MSYCRNFVKDIPHGVGDRTNPCELPGVLVLWFCECVNKKAAESGGLDSLDFGGKGPKDANTKPACHVQDDPSSFHLGPEMSIFPQFMLLASVGLEVDG